ncbi:hypothetical protein M3Y99_01461800 [Aphelenchoides fujianensis]|nr:hypothetical protein M3Y99_01461800 [Aphelenchoides fujianensis]
MADVSTPAQQQQQQQQAMTKTAKKKQKKSAAAGGEAAGSSAPPAAPPTAAASSAAASDDRDVRLTERVDMLDRKLKKLDHLAEPENQLLINDALRLQRDLLQAGVAVPSKPELVMRSMRESPHFRFCERSDDSEDEEDHERVRQALQQHGIETNGAAGGDNGRRSTQESILALLESVATSASAFAHQIHQSNLLNDASAAVAGRSAAPTTAAERREQRAERKRRVDALLERISKTPVNLLFGIRIRRKYANEVIKRYNFDPQPYYAHLTPDVPGAPHTDSGDCTPDALSAASSDAEAPPGTPPPTAPRTNPPTARKTAAQQPQPMRMPRPRTSSSSSDNDHSSSSSNLPSLQTKEGYSASRINGVDPRKKAEAEAAAPAAASTGGAKYTTRQTARRTGGPPRHPIGADEAAAAKTTRTRNAAGTNRQAVEIGDVNEDELDVLSWMERLKLEQQGGKPTPPHPSTVFNAAETASNMLQTFMMDVAAKDNMQIPPGAMNILQEALISAARENGVVAGEPSRIDEVDRQAARAMANTFIQSAAVLGSNERKARQTGGGSTAGSSSASSTTSSAAAAAAGALADIPGLTPSTANEVWQESYLQQLYASAQAETRGETSAKNGAMPPPLGSTIAATLVAAAQNTPGLSDAAVLSQKSTRAPVALPSLEPPGASGLAAAKPPAATNRTAKKKQKKKNKPAATVSDIQIAEMLAKRREIMRLQAEKQREHAAAVAELREHEARLLEAQQRKPKNPKMPYEIRYTRPPPLLPPVGEPKSAEAAGSSGAVATHPIVPGSRFAPRPRVPSPPAAWLNFVPPARPPFDVADGPWGKTYVLGPTAVTAHTQWLDRKMIARGLRAYFVIWNIEIRRLHLGCSVFANEVQSVLLLHCYEHRQGFLLYVTDGKSAETLAEAPPLTTAEDEERESRASWRRCVHDFDWGRTMRYERMCGYHQRFVKLDPLLPPLPGDFYFLINQLHYGHQKAQDHEQFDLQQYAKSLEHKNCACNSCRSEEAFMERNVLRPLPPPILPFSTQKHSVDLHLPMNFVMNQPIAEQYRLCMNQALCSERAIVIPRAPLIDEERRWARAQRQNSSATSKTAESTPPLAEEPPAAAVVDAPVEPETEPRATAKAAAKKRKKRK